MRRDRRAQALCEWHVCSMARNTPTLSPPTNHPSTLTIILTAGPPNVQHTGAGIEQAVHQPKQAGDDKALLERNARRGSMALFDLERRALIATHPKCARHEATNTRALRTGT